MSPEKIIIDTSEMRPFTDRRQVYFDAVDHKFAQIERNPDLSVYTLYGTGFLVREQVYAFANASAHINAEIESRDLSGNEREQIIKVWTKDALGRTVQDIRSFYQEFIEYSPALPIPTEIHMWGEPRVPRLFARYGDSLLLYEDLVDEREREGAPLNAIRLVEEALVEAGEDDKVISVSPSGWTGMTDPQEHKDTHVYVFGKNESLTLRTRLDQVQSLEFLNHLIGNNKLKLPKGLSEKDTIKGIMNKVVVAKNKEFEDIAEVIKEVLNSDIVWIDDNGGRSYEEMLFSIRNRDRVVRLGDRVESLIKELEEYVDKEDIASFSGEFIENLTVRIGQIILEIELSQDPDNNSKLNRADKYAKAHKALGARSGCSHAPNKKKNSAETKILCCTCPFCGRQVNAIIKNGLIICPSCHRSRSWSG